MKFIDIWQISCKDLLSCNVIANKRYLARFLQKLDNLRNSCGKEISCNKFANMRYLGRFAQITDNLLDSYEQKITANFLQKKDILRFSCK